MWRNAQSEAGQKIRWSFPNFPVIITPSIMKILFSLSLLLTLAMTGCGRIPFAGNKGAVALIDLENTAKRLGRDVVIAKELKDAGGALGEQLTAAQKEFQGELEQLKQTLGDRPSEAGNQKLVELSRNLNAQFQQKQQQAQQELDARRVALVNRFREELRPVAMKVAAGKGLGVVLIKSELVVVASDPALDITDEVIAEMIKLGQGSVATPGSSPTQ